MSRATTIAEALGHHPSERWKPIAKGEIYCSPLCGGGCQRAAFDRAVRESRELALRLGPGWRPDVWENLGWHYAVDKGKARIWPVTAGSHIAGTWSLGSYEARIDSATVVIERASDPENALGFAVQSARGASRQIAQDLNDILGEADG